MLSKLLPTAAQGSSRAKSGRNGDFAMVSEGYDGVDGPWNLSNAVQVSEPKNLIWTRVIRIIVCDLRFPFSSLHTPYLSRQEAQMESKQRAESQHLGGLYKERGEIKTTLVRMKSTCSDAPANKEPIAVEMRTLKIKLKAIEMEIHWCEKSN